MKVKVKKLEFIRAYEDNYDSGDTLFASDFPQDEIILNAEPLEEVKKIEKLDLEDMMSYTVAAGFSWKKKDLVFGGKINEIVEHINSPSGK